MIMYIGMDIGGTNIRIASAESLTAPRITDKVVIKMADFDDNMRQISEAIRVMQGKVQGIAMGLPGKVTPDTILFSRYAGQWMNKPIRKTLSDAFNCPVILDGDSPVGGLGEALYGKHRDQDFYYIAYGTGIGSARVTHDSGKPKAHKVTDEEHAAYLNPWQQECGGRGIENTLGKPAGQLSEAEWQVVMDKFQAYFLCYIEYFQPSTIVFGGGVAVKQWPRVHAAIDTLLARHPEITANISLTSLSEDAALYGAFGLLRSAVE
jgi:predicted NBD/HSP70 family sugar kinase